MESNDPSNMTFWDHVDELRKVLFRIIGVVVTLMLLAFCFKEELFGIVLAPKENDFPVYRLFDWIGEALHLSGASVSDFPYPHERIVLCGNYSGFSLYNISIVSFRFACPLCERKALFLAGGSVGICLVPHRRVVQLFSDIPFHFPLSGSLSSECRGGECHFVKLLY